MEVNHNVRKIVTIFGIEGEEGNLVPPQLCYIFNSVQDFYEFQMGKKIPKEKIKQNPKRQDLIKIMKEYKDPLATINFLIHKFRDDLNWFATYPEEGISLITTHGWEDISSEIPVICSVGSSLIQILQDYEIHGRGFNQNLLQDLYTKYNEGTLEGGNGKKLNHFKSIGCLNDFCGNKEDKVHRIKTGDVCVNCFEIWNQNFSQDQIDAFSEMIEAMRSRAVVNKSLIRVRSQCRDLISQIESYLHDVIKQTLIEIYDQNNWWTNGIKVNIRKKISEMFEEYSCLGEKFNYSYLIQLNDIWLDKDNFPKFQKKEPFQQWGNNKKEIERDFNRLNLLRNKLMHATHQFNPSKEDQDFLEDFAKKIFTK